MVYDLLKSLVEVENFATPKEIYEASKKVGKYFPDKIPTGEWLYLSSYHHIIVWPYEPIKTAMRGAIRMGMFQEFQGLQNVYFWKWEYFHERGDAIKLGKKPGLFIYGDDPLIVPKKLVLGIYYLIFHTEPDDFVNREYIYKTDNQKELL